jgi:uncharacterized protein involved in type VI secretion and phage assembly
MAADFIRDLAGQEKESKKKYQGIAIATVININDTAMLGRIQIRLSSAPGLEPWASVASPMAGFAHGWYSMPQIGDQVIIAFNNGDINEPYVIGSLWNTIRRPPITLPSDSLNKRILRTPLGHMIEFDDIAQTLKITSTTQQKISMDPESVEIQAGLGAASIQVSTTGSIKINSTTSIELNAPKITINGASAVEVKAGTSATLTGGASCTIQGAMVKIN